MWFSAQGAGRDGVTNMDAVKSALAEVGCVLARGLREMVGSVVVVAEAVAEDVPDDVVRRWVAVDEEDEGEAGSVLVRVDGQPCARCEM